MNKKEKTEKTETKPIKAELVTDESAVSEITLILPLKKKLEELEKKLSERLDKLEKEVK